MLRGERKAMHSSFTKASTMPLTESFATVFIAGKAFSVHAAFAVPPGVHTLSLNLELSLDRPSTSLNLAEALSSDMRKVAKLAVYVEVRRSAKMQ